MRQLPLAGRYALMTRGILRAGDLHEPVFPAVQKMFAL